MIICPLVFEKKVRLEERCTRCDWRGSELSLLYCSTLVCIVSLLTQALFVKKPTGDKWIHLARHFSTFLAFCRSLNGIIHQMEKFSSNLNDLSNKVEATHQTTSHGLEIGTRQRDEQLKGTNLSNSSIPSFILSRSFSCPPPEHDGLVCVQVGNVLL